MIKLTLQGWHYKSDGSDLTRYAVQSFGFLLNSSERRNKFFTWAEFALMIRAYCVAPQALAIAEHLESI